MAINEGPFMRIKQVLSPLYVVEKQNNLFFETQIEFISDLGAETPGAYFRLNDIGGNDKYKFVELNLETCVVWDELRDGRGPTEVPFTQTGDILVKEIPAQAFDPVFENDIFDNNKRVCKLEAEDDVEVGEPFSYITLNTDFPESSRVVLQSDVSVSIAGETWTVVQADIIDGDGVFELRNTVFFRGGPSDLEAYFNELFET